MKPMTASESIRWLRSQICSAGHAVSHLEDLLSLINVLDCFRELFPREFKKYAGGIGQQDSVRMIDEFFGLVDRRLFPIGDQYLEDESTYAYICRVIPVHPVMHDWWDEDPLELPLVFQVLLLLGDSFAHYSSQNDRGAIVARFSEPVQRAIVSQAGTIEDWRLSQACQQARGPLRDLHLANQILHKTVPNNTWLQISCEEVCEIPWGIEEVRGLTKQWCEAERLMKRFWRLEEWLQADRDNRIPKVVDLWSRARKQVRVKVLAQPLVGVFV